MGILSFYDAFFGPGTGNLWIMAIIYFIGYTFREASGYAKILNFKSSLFSLSIFLFYQNVNFVLGGVMAIGQFIGGYLGAHFAISKGSRLIKVTFMTVVFTNIVILFYRLLF
jgi:cupin 2 domain-containing protein